MGQTHRHPDTFTCSFAPRDLYRHFEWRGVSTTVYFQERFSQNIINKPSHELEKLHCKGEPYQFSGKRDLSARIDILLLLFKD